MFVMRVSQAYIILTDSAIESWEKDQPSQVKLQHDILTHMVYFHDNCRSIHNRPVRIRHGMNINTFAVSKNQSIQKTIPGKHTVDGRNPAPLGMGCVKPWKKWKKTTNQLVQDLFHQQ